MPPYARRSGAVQDLPDSDLARLAKDGDAAAFAALYSRYFEPVYAFARTIVREHDDALDLCQEAFLKAMNCLGSLRDCASFRTWLFSIARNAALNRVVAKSRLRLVRAGRTDEDEPEFEPADVSRFSDPGETAEANASSRLLWAAARYLDPRQRHLLQLHLRDGLDCAEISRVLGVTRNNAAVMLCRLREALAECVSTFLLVQGGQPACEDLAEDLAGAGVQSLSPRARKVVLRHSAGCSACAERRDRRIAEACHGEPVPQTAVRRRAWQPSAPIAA